VTTELQSSIWQDNDITLFPGESQTLTVTYDSSDLGANTPVITVSGWTSRRSTSRPRCRK
jgi:exo-1,4-beta-D-glucosaminidase